MTVQSPPSMLRTTPFLMSAVEAMRELFRSIWGVILGGCAGGKVYRLGAPAPNEFEGEQVGVESESGDDAGCDAGDDAGVAEFFAGVRVGDVDFDEEQAGFGDHGCGVP